MLYSAYTTMDKIDELLTRGVDTIYPTKDDLEKVLRAGKKLTLYQGFDPTGDTLHIGHMVGLVKLRQWQDLGHNVIFLIGDFTAMIGDPTGKLSARKVLTHEQTLENAKNYKSQASKILKFDGDNPAKILFNGDWLGKLSAIDFMKIAGNLTFAQVVERDMFQERIKQGQDVYTNEFLYPVMQAYDSVHMKIDLEIGGRDQMFNMLMGRKLMRQMLHKDKFVMTTLLLEDSEGKKIGKTEGNAIALTDEPSDLYAKVMTFPDEVISKCFECLSTIPMNEIAIIVKAMENGENPMLYKKKLAFEIAKDLNSEKDAQEAQEHFEKTVQQKELPTEITEIALDPKEYEKVNEDLLVMLGLTQTKAEAKRLFVQSGVEVDGGKVTQQDKVFIKHNMIIKIGKRRVVRIKTR